MKVPRTIAEVRANVAAMPAATQFVPRSRYACLVSLPLNAVNFGHSYGFNPHTGELVESLSDGPIGGAHRLDVEICTLAATWDRTEACEPYVTRDEALAFIDNFGSDA